MYIHDVSTTIIVHTRIQHTSTEAFGTQEVVVQSVFVVGRISSTYLFCVFICIVCVYVCMNV